MSCRPGETSSRRQISQCQVPFRFCQAFRTSCGRGYSFRGISPTGKDVDKFDINTAPPFVHILLRFTRRTEAYFITVSYHICRAETRRRAKCFYLVRKGFAAAPTETYRHVLGRKKDSGLPNTLSLMRSFSFLLSASGKASAGAFPNMRAPVPAAMSRSTYAPQEDPSARQGLCKRIFHPCSTICSTLH